MVRPATLTGHVSLPKQGICAVLIGSVLSGCSTMVAYKPQASTPYQTLKYVQGVGTLAVKDVDQELFMYPTFKTQGTTQPTFTIGYANNAAAPVDFTPDNVKAFFRGVPVPIYTYTEKIGEIQTEKRGKQIALAILGGLAAGAAAYGASRQTYTSNYSGAVYGRHGVTGFAGSNTVRVYDPMSGIIVGAAVGGATGLGVRQLEYNAQNQEQAANSILQENTVEPQRMVTGDLILKNCCDPYPNSNDVIRFEVTTNAKVSVFEFMRVSGSSTTTNAPPVQASVQRPSSDPALPSRIITTATPAEPTVAARAPTPEIVQVPTDQPRTVPLAIFVAAPLAVGQAPTSPARPTVTGGQDGFSASRLAKARSCSEQPTAVLVAKGPGFESYSVACTSGDALAIRCEMGQCRVLQ